MSAAFRWLAVVSVIVSGGAAAQVGRPAPTSVAELQQRLSSDPSSSRRVAAARRLGELGDSALVAVPTLLEALAQSYSYVRSTAAASLVKLAPEDQRVIEGVRGLLLDTDLGVRSAAARALGVIGPGARAVIPDLINALETDGYYGVRQHSAASLALIAPGDAALVPVLDRALRGTSRDADFDAMPANMRYYFHVESAAAMALAAMGDEGIEALVVAVGDGDRISTPAAGALAAIKSELGPRIQQFVAILRSDDSSARESASWLLSQIGDPAVPYLAEALQQGDPAMRDRAAEALRRIDTPLARETLAANRG